MLNENTEFSLPEVEKKVLEFWKRDKIFEKSLSKRKGKKEFVFYEGPPTANGQPGIHHVLARSFKDIILRYKTMRGFYVPRRAGWDTHGLPVEVGIEKELGIKNKRDLEKFGINLFNEKAKESVWKYKDEWERLTERMGYWLDMKNPYVTYENSYIESLWWVFKAIADRGFLKEKRKVIPYCSRCQTALASHEIAQPGVYKKVPDPSVYVKLQILDAGHKNEYILIWTTTPWTLPSNMFVAVGADLTYTKYKVGGDYIWSYSVPPTTQDKNGKEIFAEAVEKISGSKLVGLSYKPLFEVAGQDVQKMFKVLPAGFISTEDGTGFVHIAPAFGEEDFQLVAEHYPDIELLTTINDEGKVIAGLPGEGKFIKEADADISADLVNRGLMFSSGKIEHEYPFCWRCGSPLIYFARRSWFLEVSRLRSKLSAENEKIAWVPEHIKEGRFGEWLKEAKDWNISRERYWGTPLPIWRCGDCSAIKVIGAVSEIKENDYYKNSFYLVRHTEAESNVGGFVASGIEVGKNIAPLTKRGELQAKKTAGKLNKEKIDVIYASPMTRTSQLAREISSATGAEIIFDNRLTEINTGVFNWRPIKEYREFHGQGEERLTKTPPGGESVFDVSRRMMEFIKEINSRHKDQKIVIVSHGDPLLTLSLGMNGLPIKQFVTAKEYGFGEIRKEKFYSLPINRSGELDLHKPYVDEIILKCDKCGGRANRVKEVADVWFDSGAMPYAQNHFPFKYSGGKNVSLTDANKLMKKLEFPADYISEAMDQTRGWFYTMLATSTLLGHEAPYRNVICLGLINDKNGVKMSKSKGNIVDPWALADKYGMDAIRWYFYVVNPPGESKNFDEAELLKVYRKFHLLYYNSFVFYRTYAKGGASRSVKQSKNVLDKWILMRLSQTGNSVSENMEKYDVREAALALEAFVDDLSRWYIRRSRRRLQKPETKQEYLEASATLEKVLISLTKLSAPFIPFFSEAIFGAVKKYSGIKLESSVHLADWDKFKPITSKELEFVSAMEQARNVSSLALAERASSALKVRQPLADLYLGENAYKLLSKYEELMSIIMDEVNVKAISLKKEIGEKVELNKEISDELREEGLVRELIRGVSELRQKAELKPSNKVLLMIASTPMTSGILERWQKFILKETGATKIIFKKEPKFLTETEIKVDDGVIWLAIRKS